MKKTITVEILDRMEIIEAGIDAAHALAAASEDVLPKERRDNALEWVYIKIDELMDDLKAVLTTDSAEESEHIKIVRR